MSRYRPRAPASIDETREPITPQSPKGDRASAKRDRPQPALAGDTAAVRIEPADADTRPKGVQGDIDNIAGSILDALQAGGIIDDDKQATRLEVWFWDDDFEELGTLDDHEENDQ